MTRNDQTETANSRSPASGLLDADFGKYIDADEEMRRIVEELCAGSIAYQAAVKRRDAAWEICLKNPPHR